METLHNGYTLELCEGAFPLSTDSVALSHFVRIGANADILDLGSGCATLGLLLCAMRQDCRVTGIELDARAHTAANENIRRNALALRLKSICGDINNISSLVPAGRFTACVSNPPYYSGGAKSRTAALCRRDDAFSTDALFRAASWALKYGGDLFLVHKPEKLAQLCACGAECGLELKRLQLLRHRQGDPVSLILVQFRKGGKPGVTWREEALFDANGDPTAYYKEIYHMQEG